jgi:hypothetical protein
MTNAAIDLALGIIVPVPIMLTDKLVYVPVADKVKLLRFNVVAGTAYAVVPKFNTLNQLPLVNVTNAVPDPVKAKLGALALVPPVVPNVNVLVIFAFVIKEPVPV